MGHFRLLIEYDGHDFEGWQVQPDGKRTLQGCLIDAIETISGKTSRVTGSGRTDSGVHAEGQVVSALIDTHLSPGELLRALNGNLPRDMVILDVERSAPKFDARRDPVSKLYRYAIWNSPLRSPLRVRRFAHIPIPLDVGPMVRAAEDLVGTHDFRCFQAAGSGVEETVRSIYRLDVIGRSGDEIAIEVRGSGFLRHMVRNIAGTLIEVGRGRRSPESMRELIEARNRDLAGPTAPAEGLTLISVEYPDACPQGADSVGISES